MDILVQPNGNARCIYSEEINLFALGSLEITRASHVEPTATGLWTADLSPVGGPVLGLFLWRSDALEAELRWLREHLFSGGA